MMTTGDVLSLKKPYHRNAYEFVFDALRYTQDMLDRDRLIDGMTGDSAHISGTELLEGIRLLALERYGLLTQTVFRNWGVRSTEDFGRIVFDLIERGEMKKTERDQLSDFVEVFHFKDAFDTNYVLDLSEAFKSHR
ncbi:MAG TPA: hypothetical protein DD473_21265 [Planctomycetaceae bacterium]|nr:hypothetical protein [Planctomycetaceae bacterium]